jgi:hypothetical protein
VARTMTATLGRHDAHGSEDPRTSSCSAWPPGHAGDHGAQRWRRGGGGARAHRQLVAAPVAVEAPQRRARRRRGAPVLQAAACGRGGRQRHCQEWKAASCSRGRGGCGRARLAAGRGEHAVEAAWRVVRAAKRLVLGRDDGASRFRTRTGSTAWWPASVPSAPPRTTRSSTAIGTGSPCGTASCKPYVVDTGQGGACVAGGSCESRRWCRQDGRRRRRGAEEDGAERGGSGGSPGTLRHVGQARACLWQATSSGSALAMLYSACAACSAVAVQSSGRPQAGCWAASSARMAARLFYQAEISFPLYFQTLLIYVMFAQSDDKYFPHNLFLLQFFLFFV